MSYDLDLYFEPAVTQTRILRYFATRKHFHVKGNDVVYQNPDTGVYFFMRFQCARNFLFQKTVVLAAFEINYCRPSHFGIAAEKELSAFVAAFQPRIEDSQIDGMGEGPYSDDGFLKGWNFGNVFAVRNALSSDRDRGIPSMPVDQLRAAWAWNYHHTECEWRNPSCVVPTIMFFRIGGRARRVAVWPMGWSILLPKVDYVLVGRIVSGEKRFGLAPWSEVVEVVERAGFDTATDPLKIAYFKTRPPIADWVANIPLIDVGALEGLRPDQILDDELIAAAREPSNRIVSDQA